MSTRTFWIFWACIFLAYVLSVIFLPSDILWVFMKEASSVETLQVVLYIIGAVTAFLYTRSGIWRGGWSGGFVLLLFALRELDFQKRFTGISITRTKYYFHSDATVAAKIIAGIIVIGILFFVASFILKNRKAFIDGIRRRSGESILVLLGILMIPVANLVDSLPRLLATFDFINAEYSYIYKTAFEEMFELLMPVFFLGALVKRGESHSRRRP